MLAVEGVAFQLDGAAQLGHLVDEAQAAQGHGLGNIVLSGHADADGAFSSLDAGSDGFVDHLSGHGAGSIVVGGSIGQDRAFGSARNAGVEADDRDVLGLRVSDGVQAGLGGQSGQTDGGRSGVDGSLQLLQLLSILGLGSGANEVDGHAQFLSLGFGALLDGLPILVLEALGNDFDVLACCQSRGHADNHQHCENESQDLLHRKFLLEKCFMFTALHGNHRFGAVNIIRLKPYNVNHF